MIKKTLCFSNPAYLSLRDGQLVIKIPEIQNSSGISEALKEESVITRPIEDIGVLIMDNKQITITSGLCALNACRIASSVGR